MKAKALIAYAAKAFAAFVTPFIILALMWIGSKAGMPVPVEFDQVSTYVVTITTAILQGLWVYYQKNLPRSLRQKSRRRQSKYQR